MVFRKNSVNLIANLTASSVNFFQYTSVPFTSNYAKDYFLYIMTGIFCLMIEDSSGKGFSTKLTWIKIHQAKNFEPSGNGFYL
ncbi:hypothetical protein HR11_06140 [Porphyromonas macacae]|nr:hypothetical protein HR11_06140 [Porphyromonas macacae]